MKDLDVLSVEALPVDYSKLPARRLNVIEMQVLDIERMSASDAHPRRADERVDDRDKGFVVQFVHHELSANARCPGLAEGCDEIGSASFDESAGWILGIQTIAYRDLGDLADRLISGRRPVSRNAPELIQQLPRLVMGAPFAAVSDLLARSAAFGLGTHKRTAQSAAEQVNHTGKTA
ncbi:MAG: hypothetical protein E6J91_45725 [Deltaproteobacteria bacterium]|nr:MAG: hypothetical protein E6J91_45725 [Deltaproteobacteria bacterium]